MAASAGGLTPKSAEKIPELPHDSSSHSIIAGKSGRMSRTDTHGNSIEKGKREHKVSFRDEANGAPVEDVKEVTAYKGGPFSMNADYGGQSGCGCTVM